MKVLIIGATSAIAQETAKRFATDGAELYLIGRDERKLLAVQEDLLVRGAKHVMSVAADLNQVDRHEGLLGQAVAALQGLDVVLIAHGSLSNQQHCQASVPVTMQELMTNALSTISLLTLLANDLEKRRGGCLAVISSVAGDRGRQSNYVYGTAKGAISIFLQGLRNRLARSGVTVITIKPGFVDTPMTQHLPKNLLFAAPSSVGAGIYRAIRSRSDVVYIPWFWSLIMLAIRAIPERVYKKLSL